MKTLKALLDFVLFSASEKVIFFKNVLLCLTANPAFQNPDVPLAEANTAVDNFELALLAAADGSHTAISLMHDSEKAVTLKFRNLALYVTRLSEGDASKILSSGFNVSSQPITKDKPILSVTDGTHRGTAKGSLKSVPKSGAYVWEINHNYNGVVEWKQIAITTQTTYVVENLTVGETIEIRAAAITPEGQSDYCVPVSKLIN